MTEHVLDNRTARRLFLDRHLLLRQTAGSGTGEDLEAVLGSLGFVQVDSVNTLARAHDLILWSRRSQYRAPALTRLVAKRRSVFEHWTHDASVIPMDSYPMWRLKFEREATRMRARWPAARRDGWQEELDTVLRHIADRGATCSLDVGADEQKGSSGWWDWHPSKTALEYLWRAGQLAVCHRRGFRKYYDLAERVIPDLLLRQRLPEADILDWTMTSALNRLGFATSGELAAFFDIATPGEAKDWCRAALADGRIRPVDVEMADGSLRHCLTTDAHLNHAADLPAVSNRVRVLSPFDPALRDRKRAERLFDFHYRIEIYVPEAKRRYGYYVFPVLQGDRLIGRLDASREQQVIRLRKFWPEPGVKMGKARSEALLAELERVRHLAGAERIDVADGWLQD